MMKSLLAVIFVAVVGGSVLMAAPKTDWFEAAPASGGSYAVKSLDKESFAVTLKCVNPADKTAVQVCTVIDRPVGGERVLVFSCRLNAGAAVMVQPLLSYREDGKSIMKFGPKLSLRANEKQTAALPLNRNFGLKTAAEYQLWQLKFAVTMSEAAIGAVAGLEIGSVSFMTMKDAAAMAGIVMFPAQSAVGDGGTKKGNDWLMIAAGPGGTYEVDSIDAGTFAVKLRRNGVDGAATVQLCRTIDRPYHSQNKLMFSCRLINDNPVVLQPLLSYRENAKSLLKFGPKLTIRSNGWKQYVLPLDTDFKFADAIYHLWQLKISAAISGSPAGTEAGVEIRDLRICSQAEAGVASGKADVIVHPVVPPAVPPAPGALKVFFAFDNEDYSNVYIKRRKSTFFRDIQTYPGYRYMLLEAVRGEAAIADSPEKADVIVYSAARPDPTLAARIVKTVANGTPLYAAGMIADPEIAAILPAAVKELPRQGLPERLRLKAAAAPAPWARGLSDAAFGIYSRLEPKSGCRTLLQYADGSPAVVEGVYGKGKVMVSALTAGAEIIPDKTAPDAFMLRMLSLLTGKPLSEKDLPRVCPDRDGFLPGSGPDNFGRFGFILGDGLLCESINNTLDVTNGSAEYSFSAALTPKIALTDWTLKDRTGNSRAIDWRYKWLDQAKYELTTQSTVPTAWKGRDLCFLVEGGIDDTAEIRFNGRPIGKIDTATPQYWMTPHRHTVPAALVRTDRPNEIKIVTENLRGNGGFGTCPELRLPQAAPTPLQFVPDRINQLGKGGMVTEADGVRRRFDTSLAFPGIRWEVFSDKVVMGLSNIAESAVYPVANGLKTVDLLRADAIPTDWNQPWLLLFGRGKGNPLLLVFARRPDVIAVERTGSGVSGLSMRRAGGVGMIVPLWLYGRAEVDSNGWDKSLPDAVKQRIAFWYPKAFTYPVAVGERFKIDEQAGRVIIRTGYRYLVTENDWNIRTAPYAPVSPLAFYTRGKLFESTQATDWQLVTSFGNYAARDGGDTVEWSLPLPHPALGVIPAIAGRGPEVALANRVFAQGVRWSAGGATKQEAWTPAYPMGEDFAGSVNINFHGWLHGINQVLSAPFELDKDNGIAFDNRLRLRMFEPIERFRFKAVHRWREEPMSRLKYATCFSSIHQHSTKYAPGTGSCLDYGDQNETAHMILAVMQKLADRHGQREFVRANAGFIREVARLLMISDDWAYLACHCRESGLSATIDMLNCEYASMMHLARLAEISGDDVLRQQALYRGARRLVPTMARLTFKDYAVKNGLVAYPENVLIGVGFTEEGFHYRTKGTAPDEIDLFDMSQGTPPDLVAAYRRYAPGEIAPYFRDVVFPYMRRDRKNCLLNSAMLNIAAQGSDISRDELGRMLALYLADCARLEKLGRDWPGMTLIPDLNQVLYRLDGQAKIHTAEDLTITEFRYDPSTAELTLRFTPGPRARLILQSELEPVDRRYRRAADGRIDVPPAGPGREQVLKIAFRRG